MKSSARFIFIASSLLALGQMLWWAYLIVTQQGLIAQLLNSEEALHKTEAYRMMIFAEGLFFIAVLVFGIWVAYKSLSRELQLQRSQSNFLGAITHELKTPLTNVRLCLDSLERSDLNEEARKRFIQRAQTAVDKLVEEVEMILAISGKGPLSHDIQEFDLNDAISTIIRELDTSNNVEILFQNQGKMPIVAPPLESRLILRNLLDNAVKYSRMEQAPAKISIATFSEKNKVIVRITDNGIGLTSEESSHAFDAFYRGEDGRKLDPTGTGLGLSLVKRLAEAFQIQISLKSDGRGKGTTAQVTWPSEKSL